MKGIKGNVKIVEYVIKLDEKKINDVVFLRKEYKENVGLSVDNIKRVWERVLRKDLRERLNKVLESKGIKYNDFEKKGEKIVGLINEKKGEYF